MILAIDSTQSAGSIAFADGDDLLFSSYFDLKVTHSETLVPEIEHGLKLLGCEKKDIGGIVVALGPGSFTGLRIGLATAKGLAMGLNVPLYPYNSLELAAVAKYNCGGQILSVIDAKMSELYYALYDEHLMEIVAPGICYPHELGSLSLDQPFIVGSGVSKAKEIVSDFRSDLAFQSIPTAIQLMALHKLKGIEKDYNFEELAALEPLYLRESTAQIRRSKI